MAASAAAGLAVAAVAAWTEAWKCLVETDVGSAEAVFAAILGLQTGLIDG